MRAAHVIHSAALALLLLPGRLTAQRSDRSWLDNCRDRDNYDREVSCEVRHLSMKRGSGPIQVDPGDNGGVEVVGWDADTIGLTARVQAHGNTQEDADALAHQITVTVSGSSVQVDGPSVRRHAGWGVEIVLYVPRHTDLSLHAQNGPVSVANVSGKMDLSTVNGPLSLQGVAGDVHARAQNGPVDVELKGSSWEGAGLDAETVNGPVDLSIPHAYSANLETGTVNGPWDLRMPLTVTLIGRAPRHITTKLGSGGAPVRVVTTNGPVTVEPAE
jgi:DUF4097 and DUF4098 domain-containing protein YvlB